jgi:hypothetical protein
MPEVALEDTAGAELREFLNYVPTGAVWYVYCGIKLGLIVMMDIYSPRQGSVPKRAEGK